MYEMVHDFKNFPELTNGQMAIYYFESPHKQIFESFTAKCVKVHDGDTITVRWSMRDFDFPVRFSNIAAPEVAGKKGLQAGGHEARDWLIPRVLGKTVDIIVDSNNRVEKFGRLLGRVEVGGMDVGEEAVVSGVSKSWNNRNEGLIFDPIPSLDKVLS